MRFSKISLIVSIAFLIVISGCQKKEKEAVKDLEEQAEITETAKTEKPELDWLVIEDDTYIPVLDELGDYLNASQQAFVQKNNKSAAKHIRDGIAFLKVDLDETRQAQKVVLLDEAINGLEKVAQDLDQGKIVTQKQLKDAFKTAYVADVQEHLLVVKDKYWIPLVEVPEDYFQSAHDNFLNKEMKAAAAELRKGAALLRVEAARAKGDSKAAIHSSVTEIEKLAEDMEKGVDVSEQKLSETIARAHHALALHHREMAAEDWATKEGKKAGNELKAAAYHFEKAAKWAGYNLETASEIALKDSKAVAKKLIEEAGYAEHEVGKALSNLKTEIDKLNDKLRPIKLGTEKQK